MNSNYEDESLELINPDLLHTIRRSINALK
jgi:hypothetical protein